MSVDQLIKETDRFVEQYKANYESLVGKVKEVCNEIRKDYQDIIKDVYSRSDKQGGTKELKATEKIAYKLLELQRGFDQEQKKFAKTRQKKFKDRPNHSDVPDIIGITIVVHYPDQIVNILNIVTDRLKEDSIYLDSEFREKNDFGYYAVHAIYRSDDLKYYKLCCEVQCKTMLHDSWSTKMHDLTYKPIGYLDERLKSMMQVFGSTLQQIEIQSQTLRDMIQERWDVDAEWRRLAEEGLLQHLRIWKDRENHSDEAKNLFAAIEKDSEKIKSLPLSDDLIMKYMGRVTALCKKNISEGWILAGFLATTRKGGDLLAFLRHHVERWLTHAQELAKADRSEGEQHEAAISAVPIFAIVAGNSDLAIEYYRQFIDNPDRFGLPDTEIGNLKFNLANILIEKDYYQPTKDARARSAREEEIDGLLRNKANATGLWRNAYDDAVGFKEITFRDNEEQIIAGIAKCSEACPAGDTAAQYSYAVTYCRLHVRLGWRRVFELQARDRAVRTREKSGKT